MASAAAAATSGGRRREAEQHVAKMARMRRQLSHKRQALHGRAEQVFLDLSAQNKVDDDDDGHEEETWLLESQMDDFLQRVLRKHRLLEPDAVQLVVDTARKSQLKEGKTPPSDKPGALSKTALVNSVEKYGEYIKNAKSIDIVFQKYDKAKDGDLSRQELMRALQDYETKAQRAKNGMLVRLVVLDEDVDWIIEQCDADGSGKINQAEYLPAIAAWEELAQMKMEKYSSCCIIL